jgi:hypothetical protein
VHHSKIAIPMSLLGHSRPSNFVPVLNNVRYASDSDHSRYESELTLWARTGLMQCSEPERRATSNYVGWAWDVPSVYFLAVVSITGANDHPVAVL